MARQSGLIKIKGTLDNVSFYKTKDGHLARMKTSVDAKRIANDPAFERTRENNKEFASSASSGKLMRDALRPMALNAADGRVISRLTKVMTAIKNLDAVSARGQRNVGVGISDPNAIIKLKGFEFNKEALLSAILFKPMTVDTGTGEVVITDLVPQMDIVWPQGTTHVQFTCGFAGIDFVNGDKDLQLSTPVNLPVDSAMTTVVLTPASSPTVAGTNLYLLKVEFFQEINGVQYTLKNGAYNALRVIEAQ
jgi:hypothetical protein